MSPVTFKKLDPTASAADLERSLEEAKAERESAQAEKSRLEASRKSVLLNGDDRAAERHDAAIAAAARRVDRAGALIEEIEPLLAAAQEREKAEALNARRQEAEIRAAELRERRESEYTAPAKKIAAYAADYVETKELVAAVNAELRAAGRDDIISDPDWLDRREPDVEIPEEREERIEDVQVYDEKTGSWRWEKRTVSYIARHKQTKGGKILPPLAENIRLPAPRIGEPDIWPPRK